ncbi:MAG: TIGR00730 family Rossman fold protein [Pseudomonadota bacterium]|nr:TIGR00730 family Rossman fold protein [Pseudomonadota bacterium]
MKNIASLCVYCGASNSADPAFLDAASRLGDLMARNGIALVYGGGRMGLMGRVADAVLAGGGQVTGIIPEHLYRIEVQHEDVSDLVVVQTMHERKAEMFRRSDAFCVLPGGIGTLDEMVEIITWRDLQLHDRPVVVVNQDGYFTPFRTLLDHMIRHRLAHPRVAGHLTWVHGVEEVLPALAVEPAPCRPARPERI